MSSRLLTLGAPSALALAGAGASLLAMNNTKEPGQGSAFDFNLNFMGETLSYKKNQVVSAAKEVGKEIKEGGVPKAVRGGGEAPK